MRAQSPTATVAPAAAIAVPAVRAVVPTCSMISSGSLFSSSAAIADSWPSKMGTARVGRAKHLHHASYALPSRASCNVQLQRMPQHAAPPPCLPPPHPTAASPVSMG